MSAFQPASTLHALRACAHAELVYEAKLYKILQGAVGIPYVRWYGVEVRFCDRRAERLELSERGNGVMPATVHRCPPARRRAPTTSW